MALMPCYVLQLWAFSVHCYAAPNAHMHLAAVSTKGMSDFALNVISRRINCGLH